MKFKKGLIFICLIICLFTIASVAASDVNETAVADEIQSDELINVENQDENDVVCEEIVDENDKSNDSVEVLGSAEDNDVMSYSVDEDALASPPYNVYSVRVSDTSMTYGKSGSIKISIIPVSGYDYAYDFYLYVYDSNNELIISENYYSSSSDTQITHQIGATDLNPGTYTIKIVNYEDGVIMSIANLKVGNVNIEAQDVTGACDKVIKYRVRVSENDEYKYGLKVKFTCNGNEYYAYTDDNGYATLNIHLKAGTHSITAKYLSTVKNNKIVINKKYVANKYKSVKIKSPKAYFKQSKKKITYSFEGNLKGYFKIYKGKSLKYSKAINTNGYINDYFKYNKHSYSYAINKIKDTGKYTAKIIGNNGKVLAKSTFKITKAPTKAKGKSFKTTGGHKKSVRAYIYDKKGSRVDIGGTAKFKIGGKVYKTKVKHGSAKVKVKFPYKEKTYKCKVKFSGDKKYKGSSAKFKVKVRKLASVMGAYSEATKTDAKNVVVAFVAVKNFDGTYSRAKSGAVKFKIAGKTYKARVKNGIAKVKITAPSKAKTYKCKAVYLGTKSIKKSSDKFKMVVKKPVSKYKVITTKAKMHWVKKHSGKFTVVTKIWDMTAGLMAPYKYIDTTLYKNGYQVYNSKYSVNYKINGRWTGWAKYGTTSTAHHRYAVYDWDSVDKIKVKFKRNVNSYIGA